MLQITAASWLLLLAAYEELRKNKTKQTTQTHEQNYLQKF